MLFYDYEVVLQKRIAVKFAEKQTLESMRKLEKHYREKEGLDIVSFKYQGPSDDELEKEFK